MHKWISNVCNRHANRTLIKPNFLYKDLLAQTKKEKENYRSKNISSGDRVVLAEYNSPEFLGKLNALWQIGATPCLVSPKLNEKKKEKWQSLLTTSSVTSDEPEALLMLTSGTSSKTPKGVRLTHRNLVAHMDMLREHIPAKMFNENDRTLSFLPWTHCYGLMGECFSVMDRGASMAILSKRAQEQFRFPTFFKDLQLCQPTILFVVPYLLEVIMRKDESMRTLITNRQIRKKFWFGSNVRYIVSGGAYLKPEIRRAYWKQFDIEIIQGYGCTEMSPMVSLQKTYDPMDDSVGDILPNIQIDIREDEVWTNGPNRFLGYVGENPLQLSDFYNTRDRGYVKNGKLYLTGRSSNIIKLSNGKFIDIHLIEMTLKDQIPYCRQVCVWRNDDDGKFYGVAHVVNHRRGEEATYHRTYKCFDEDVSIFLQKVSFVSPLNGTMTQKGEMCRPMIRSLYANKIESL